MKIVLLFRLGRSDPAPAAAGEPNQPPASAAWFTARPTGISPWLHCALFVILGVLVFFPAITLAGHYPADTLLAVRVGTLAFFAVVAAAAGYLGLRRYRRVTAAWFTACAALLVASAAAGAPMRYLDLTVQTAKGLAVAKLSEFVLIVGVILLLARVAGLGRRSIFVSKGNLQVGLMIGLGSFVLLACVALLQAREQGVLEKVWVIAPWVLIFVVANGFMEELLFRGLFLRAFEPFTGSGLANVATALVFALGRARLTYLLDLPGLVAVTFLLALYWAAAMRRSGSLLAPGLFHAGTDAVLMTGIMASL